MADPRHSDSNMSDNVNQVRCRLLQFRLNHARCSVGFTDLYAEPVAIVALGVVPCAVVGTGAKRQPVDGLAHVCVMNSG